MVVAASNANKSNKELPPEAQLVRWGPVDQKPAGILVEDSQAQVFVPWSALKLEVESRLLPQVRRVPSGATVEVRDLGDRKDWVVRIVDPTGKDIGAVWFGPNPEAKWQWDGLVRLGEPEEHNPERKLIWQIFQRYSDGSYRRIEAFVITENDEHRNIGFPQK
jgi:hypothetical protein